MKPSFHMHVMSALEEHGAFAAFVFACCLLVPIGCLVTGLVISHSWNWFLAPITGLQAISLTEGIGLSVFLAFIGTSITLPLTKWEPDNKPDDSLNVIVAKVVGKLAGRFIFGPLIALALAWLWHTFVISPPGYVTL